MARLSLLRPDPKGRETMTQTNWPGMTNKALAAVLSRAAANPALTDFQRDALSEAAERLRESLAD